MDLQKLSELAPVEALGTSIADCFILTDKYTSKRICDGYRLNKGLISLMFFENV